MRRELNNENERGNAILWIVGPGLLVGVCASIIGAYAAGVAGAIISGLFGTVAGIGIGTLIALQIEIPSNEVEPFSTPAGTQPQQVPHSAALPHFRYIANNHTYEIHDLKNIQPACNYDLMAEEHKVGLSTLTEVKEVIERFGYEGCRWCMNAYNANSQ